MLCDKCLRPHVDAMTLNSTGVNKTLCYQSETGGDPLCQLNQNTIKINPDETSGSTEIAVPKNFPLNNLNTNVLIIAHNHESCCLSIDCIYANQTPITARLHMVKENGAWKSKGYPLESLYRIDLPKKDVSDSARKKILHEAETFINSFFHHHPDVYEDVDSKHLSYCLKELDDEQYKLSEKIKKLSEQKQKLIKQKAERYDKVHA